MATHSQPEPSPAAGVLARATRPRSVRRWALIGFANALLVLFAIQFVPYGRDHVNPPVQAEPAWDSPQTRALFFRACGDCHSNETVYPWYTSVAPFSWLAARDVEEGREEFNVSEWGRPENEGAEAAETVKKGEMPLWFYTIPHPEAKLTAAERQALIAGLTATFGARKSDTRR